METLEKNATESELKAVVKDKYGAIALTQKKDGFGCCGGSGKQLYTIMRDSYIKIEGYNPDADLGLGCGLPTEFADIREGETVLDLGAGAGNDAFIARRIVGESGKVIGLDMTEEMVKLANANKDKIGYKNIEFVLGEIESMPVESNSIDVILSNCVLNLVPNKEKAFAEIFRVLRPGKRFCVSDIVLKNKLPDSLCKPAEFYAGCVSGAELLNNYLQIIKDAGFVNVNIVKEKSITIPGDILAEYLTREEMAKFGDGSDLIFSITVYGEKPE